MTLENKRGILVKLSKLALLGAILFVLHNFVSCDKKSPTEPEKPASIEGNVVGLIKGQPVTPLSSVELCNDSGAVIYRCEVNNDTFFNNNINNPGSCTRIRIRSDEAIDRETNIRLTPGANNVVTLNMIESDDVTGFKFEDYKIVGHIGGGSPRWKSYVPKFYIYDQSLFHGMDIVGTFTPSQINMNRIMGVIKNDIPKLTNNFVSNPIIERESKGHPHPPGGIDAEGYVIIIFREDIRNLLTGYLHSNFDIYNGAVDITSHVSDIPRGAFSQDICEPMGYIDTLKKCNYSIFGPDHCLPNYPTAFDRQHINKIKFGRPPGNMSWMSIPDYDQHGEPYGLIIMAVPMNESNQFNQFNQFQQPTFRPDRQKPIEKREIEKRSKKNR